MTCRSMTPAHHGLSSRVVASLHQVLSTYPEVEQVILYGFRATGGFEPASDIDLTPIDHIRRHGIVLYQRPPTAPQTLSLRVLEDPI